MRNTLAFLILTLFILAPAIYTSPTPSGPMIVASAPFVGTDYPWAMFHHDPQRTGATPASAPTTPSLMWTFNTGATVYSSPAVANGAVYITTYDWASNTGNLYAIDEYTGRQKWVFNTGAPIYASPAVANGMVYVASRDWFVYAINEQTGALVWKVFNSRPVTSSPVVADGKVFYGTWYDGFWGRLRALDSNNGVILWQYLGDDSIISSPSVQNGRVFFGQNNGLVVALDETTGIQAWNTTVGGNVVISTAPTVAYGSVFIGTDSKFVALDELTGATLWTFNTGGKNATSGAVSSGIVYFGTGKGNVRAVNATTGVEVWTYPVGSIISSSPALALGSDTLVVGSHDGNIYALNLTTGALLWSYQTSGPVSSSPAVADGRVYVGSQDHNVYGLGPAAPALQASITTSSTTLKPGETSTLTITVTNSTAPQSNATLVLTSSSGGGFTLPLEQSPGVYLANYTAPLVSQQVNTTITVRAGKPGYLDVTASTTITLTPFPRLTVAVTPRPSSITPGGEVLLLIMVTNGTKPVPGVSIFLSSTGGGSFSGLTDGGDGNYTAIYTTSLQDSNPTLLIQASIGFSTGQAQVTIAVSGVPDLTRLKLLGFPLLVLVAALFLLFFAIFVGIIAKSKGKADYSAPYVPSYALKSDTFREGLSRRFAAGSQWGWRP